MTWNKYNERATRDYGGGPEEGEEGSIGVGGANRGGCLGLKAVGSYPNGDRRYP